MSHSDISIRRKSAYIEGIVSVVVNTILFFFKYYIGLIYNSIAVIADAFHTLSDSLTSIILILGYVVTRKPPDHEHPFGHGRAEFIGGLIIGVLLAMVGYDFTTRSIDKLINKLTLTFSYVLIIVLVVSTLIKLLLSLWAYHLGEKAGSQPIKADAWHHVSDSLATGILAIAIFLGRNFWWIDGVLGLVVSGIIFLTSAKIIYDASSELLGRAPAKSELEALEKVIREEFPEVKRLHHVHFHRYGDHVEVTFHVELPGNISLKEAHEIATRIENTVRRKLKYEATIHVESDDQIKEHVD
ncbi:MAG: cation diffusion facilitator family transporter [Desulfurococcaceae archaeon]